MIEAKKIDIVSTKTSGWIVVALLWVVALLNYLDRQVIFSLFPLLKTDLKLSDVELGLLGTVFLWIYGLLSPLSGYLADRFGRVRVIIFSLIVWSFVTLLTGCARDFNQLIALRALMGVSEAFYIPAALALIADHHAKGRLSLATGIHMSGIYAGIILGGVGGGWVGEHYGWRAPFAWLGIFGILYALIALLPMLRMISHPQPAESSQKSPLFFPALGEVLRLRGFKTLTAAFGAFSLANWAIYTWLPFYLYEKFQMKLTAAGFSATFYIQAASVAGILLGGLVADRLQKRSKRGRVTTLALGIGLAAPCLFIVGLTSTTLVLIAALVIFGLGRGFFDANTMPVLSLLARAELRATGYGILNMVGTLSGGVIAAAAGHLKSVIGLGGVFQLLALLLSIAALMSLQIAKNES